MKHLKSLPLAAALCFAPPIAFADQVLYQYSTWYINGSKAGPIAQFQDALNETLNTCDINVTLKPDGVFGGGTKSAIAKVAACAEISPQLPADSPARNGAITTDLWKLILPDIPVPTVGQRAASLKLTFEATDYDRMQWNFCQNKPFYRPAQGQTACFSNDRAAFITWGPNGATAGHGREVQAIVNQYLATPGSSEAFDTAFGAEAANVRRMLILKHEENGPLETYLCGIWLDTDKRAAWTAGFKTLGRTPMVQSIYREVYASRSFDGGKIARFYEVWTSDEFGLGATELDHAWFVDRSAHMGISKAKLTNAMRALKTSSGAAWPPTPAMIRQHISTTVIPGGQRKDRLGRDVAYYVAGVGESGLSSIEADAWANRGRRNAVDIGLSDARLMPAYDAGGAINHPMPDGRLSEAEMALCPVAVLNPQKPI